MRNVIVELNFCLGVFVTVKIQYRMDMTDETLTMLSSGNEIVRFDYLYHFGDVIGL